MKVQVDRDLLAEVMRFSPEKSEREVVTEAIEVAIRAIYREREMKRLCRLKRAEAARLWPEIASPTDGQPDTSSKVD